MTVEQLPLFNDMPFAPWLFDPLPRGAFEVICADPPWTWNAWSDRGLKKSAQRHYSCMGLEDIKALPVAALAAPDSILLLWATTPMLPHALETMSAWGFSYKSHIIWRKTTALGKVRMGCGYWARSMHELVLIGCRGKPKVFKPALPSIFNGLARAHSRKPDEFYRLVELRSQGLRRADLFAREERPGFAAWGDEAGLFNQGAENAVGCGQNEPARIQSPGSGFGESLA